jgi:hypothetical protein
MDSARFSTRANAAMPHQHTIAHSPPFRASRQTRASPAKTVTARIAKPTNPNHTAVSTNVLCELATQLRPEYSM